jgi:hypothetical protein
MNTLEITGGLNGVIPVKSWREQAEEFRVTQSKLLGPVLWRPHESRRHSGYSRQSAGDGITLPFRP